MSWILATVVLLVGTSSLWLFSEFLSGRQQASLHVGNVLLITLIGLLLFGWLGWPGIAVALAVAALWWGFGTLHERRSMGD